MTAADLQSFQGDKIIKASSLDRMKLILNQMSTAFNTYNDNLIELNRVNSNLYSLSESTLSRTSVSACPSSSP